MKNSLIDSGISHTADSQSDWKDPRQFQNGCSVINSIIILQTYVPTTGPTLKDTVTEKCLPVIRGAVVKENVQFWVLIFPVSTISKKMSMFKTYMAGSILGWALLISTLKGRLCGMTELLLISITGQATNQTTSKMKTVSIPLGFFLVTSTSGMMSIALIVTSSLARKVPPYLCSKFGRRTQK